MLLMPSRAIFAAFLFVGMAAGAITWVLLAKWGKKHSAEPELVKVLLAAGVACRVVYALLNPTFNSPDEQEHFKYVQYVAEHHRLPVQTSVTGAATKDSEYHQAPLYYIALSPVYVVAEVISDNKHFLSAALRLATIFLWWLTARSTQRLLDRLEIRDEFLRIGTMGFMCLLPAWVMLSSSINNDILLILCSAWILETLAAPQTMRNAVILGLLCGIAMLSKVSAVFLIFPVVAIVQGMRWILKEMEFGKVIGQGAVTLLIAGALWAPGLYWNLSVYHHWLGFSPQIAGEPVVSSSPFQALRDGVQVARETFWTAGGGYNKARFLPTIGVHLTYLALVGLGLGIIKRGKPFEEWFSPRVRAMLIGLAIAVVLNSLAVVLTFPTAHSQGRFLFPLLGPIGLATVTGLSVLGLGKYAMSSIHATGFFVGYNVGALIYTIAYFAHTLPIPWYPPV